MREGRQGKECKIQGNYEKWGTGDEEDINEEQNEGN